MNRILTLLLIAFFSLGCAYLSFAQDILVSGAGSVDVNGVYVQNGTHNGKPYYQYWSGTYNYAIVWECYYECPGWHLIEADNVELFYVTADGGATPPSTGWFGAINGISPAPVVGRPTVSYTTSIFLEGSANDGSFDAGITILHSGVGGNTFAGTNGEDFVASAKAVVTNVPAGLTARIVRVSDTQLSFTLVGNAVSHVNANDISNLTVTFQNAAFSGGVAVDIIGYSKNDLGVNFRQALTVASSGADFTSVTAAVAAATDYDEIRISGEVFTELNITVNKILTFRGTGADQTVIQANASPNSNAGRVFNIGSGLNYVKFYDLTIRNGSVSGTNQYGGGLYSNSNLEMHRCAVRSCNSVSNGQAQGGGVNVSEVAPYALFNACLFANNTVSTTNIQSAAFGGGVFARAIDAQFTNCTFSNNSSIGIAPASQRGGGLIAYGTGLAQVRNCTFNGNSAQGSGGGIQAFGNVTMENVVSYGNTAPSGADFHRSGFTTNARNCIIGVAAAQSGLAINGTSSNVSSSNPFLQALANNGGATQTHGLWAGSPAINAGLAGVSDYDQRGYYRNGARDIGAFEYEGLSNVWNGRVNTEWTNNGNWADNSTPISTDDVIIASASNQPIVLHAPSGPTLCAGLLVENGATLTIAGGALTASGTTTNDGTILITANATGMGSFIDNGTITGAGSFQMQQYLTGAGGATPNGNFHYVSSPVAGATSAVYDAAGANKLWSANESTQSYTEITDNSTALNTLQGYVARVGAYGTFTFDGSIFNTGNQSASGLTRTGTTATNRGYNLIGNPYPSCVNWDAATAGNTNMETTIWYRTHTISDEMTFDTYNATGGVGTANNFNGVSATGNVPPGQAFWVRVSDGETSGSVSFNNAMRNHFRPISIYRLAAEEGVIRMTLANSTASDEAILLFNQDASDDFDAYDSHKFWANNIPQLYMNEATDTIVINGLYSTETNPVVDLGVKLPTAGNYTLNANSITLEGESVHLEDRLLNIFQDLNEAPSYAFTSDAGNIGNRFALHFGMSVTGISEAEMNSRVYTSNGNQLNIILSENATNGRVEVLDMAGRIVHTSSLNTSRTTLDLNNSAGVYLIRVETAKGTDTHRVLFH